jgi:hypothetical protein
MSSNLNNLVKMLQDFELAFKLSSELSDEEKIELEKLFKNILEN